MTATAVEPVQQEDPFGLVGRVLPPGPLRSSPVHLVVSWLLFEITPMQGRRTSSSSRSRST